MEHLSAQQIATLRAKLDVEATELRERISADRKDMVEDVNPDPGDIEDDASADAMRFQIVSMLDHDQKRLAEVEAALARMEGGSFGICEDTDEPIPYRRLELEPTARYTVEALELREQEAAEPDRHGNEPVGY